MKCFHKPELCEAIRWKGEEAFKQLPPWLAHMGQHYDPKRNVLTLSHGPQQITAAAGDVLVRHPAGNLEAVSHAAFEEHWVIREDDEEEGAVDLRTRELLKPRGNDGKVNSEICLSALWLTDAGHELTIEDLAEWTEEQLDRAYDWAMRTHIHASDNDDVYVPKQPAFIKKRPPAPPKDENAAAVAEAARLDKEALERGGQQQQQQPQK